MIKVWIKCPLSGKEEVFSTTLTLLVKYIFGEVIYAEVES